MRRALLLFLLVACAACSRTHTDPNTVTVILESSPSNLDPRIGTDAASQRLDELMFDGLLGRDANFHVVPALAESWDHPDALTYVFHLRHGVRFHDGRAFTARDLVYTLTSMRNGSIVSPKAGAYKSVANFAASDDYTVTLHLKSPDPALLWNLSSGAIGIVPEGSGRDFGQHPVGTGPFRFVRYEVDNEVVLERSPTYWQAPPNIPRVRFAIVPDAITAALELRKGSADISLNFLSPDLVHSLASDAHLQVVTSPGTRAQYLGFNLRDAELKDVRVRRAISLSIDRDLIVRTLLGGYARPADSLLPPEHWAYDAALKQVPYDPQQANAILDQAGYARGNNGIRFHLTMKTSTDENSRLLAAVLQQQLRAIGIALDIRSFEFATFYADVVRGAFQMYSLRWVGGNEDPDILRYAFASSSMPPNGANRGGYSSPAFDALVASARNASTQEEQKRDYDAMQQLLANNLPVVDLWYQNNVAVTSRRISGMTMNSSGSYSFLRTIRLSH